MSDSSHAKRSNWWDGTLPKDSVKGLRDALRSASPEIPSPSFGLMPQGEGVELTVKKPSLSNSVQADEGSEC